MDIQEQLDRIEAKLDALLEKRKPRAKPAKTQAEAHDEAVADLMENKILLHDSKLEDALKAFCDSRRAMRKYLTPLAITALMKKLAPFSINEQIAALNDSVANGWQSVFPTRHEGGGGAEEDWFSGQTT